MSLDSVRGIVDEVSGFGCLTGDIFEVCFGEVVDMVLDFLCCCADFIDDGDEGFEEIGEFLWREDDEGDGSEDDEFLPADVEHGGIVGGAGGDCKGGE